MKILPVFNNQTIKNYTLKANTMSTQGSIQYAYNLPCDTISFEGRKDKIHLDQDDGWLDARDMNSDAILKYLQNGSYEQVVKFMEGLNAADWEPNYCLFDSENGDHCLMGLVLEKIADCPDGTETFANLRVIAGNIAAHPDFKYVNDSTGEDTLYAAITAYSPETAIDIIFSRSVQDNLSEIDFDKFVGIARELRLTELIGTLQNCKNQALESARKAGKLDEQNDIDITVKKLKASLSKYELNQNPNDPKNLGEVGGMFQAKKDIEEFIIKPWHKDFRDKIIENKLNRPSGFLLSGPPGCGKTYIMKAIAAQTGYDLYEINLANIGDSAGYKTQNDLKQLFDNLEEVYKLTGEPSIVVLDELDSIAMDRKNCHTDWKKDDINALLMVINNSAQRGVIVVGATNNPDSLDSAVKRSGRLDKHIEINLPDYEETKDIVDKVLSDRPIASELLEDIDTLTQKLKGMSPADISSILHNTCLNAIYEYKDSATMEDFDKMYEALKRDQKPSGRIRIKGFSTDD